MEEAKKYKILLCEDDTNLGMVLKNYLELTDYDVTLERDGRLGLAAFQREKFDICLLDVMMPKKDGFTLARDIRQINGDVPILFLTAKSMTEDKIEGFNAGGDDYLTKPFSVEELNLRIKSLLKRVNIRTEIPEEKVFNVSSFIFDTENLTLTLSGEVQSLTKKEAQILKILYKFKNQVLPREVILNTVWGQDDYFVGRSLDVFITKLRKYLKDDETIQILNIHGVGFKLEIKA